LADTIQLRVDQDAWRAEPGPILLLAGPGTGKTHQLGLRIKFLVQEKHASPEAITVITFTKEAADNMRRRIADEDKPDVYLPPESRPGRIMTMHSLGLEIVRDHRDSLGLPEDFLIVTDSKLRSLLFRDAAFLAGHGEHEADDANRARQKNIPLEAGSVLSEIIKRYESILRACHAIDYDDQILLACRLLSKHPEILAKYAPATQHLLIDEYQDINPGQRELIELLSKGSRAGLFVVGDDDQSIYQFRGGDPRFIREFHREFGKPAKTLCLVESRRCPDTVVCAGLDVLKGFDKNRVVKPDPTYPESKKQGIKVQEHNAPSDDEEAEIIARLTRKALPKRSVLILVPTKLYAEKIKRALRMRRITYTHPPNLDDSGFLVLQRVQEWTQHQDDSLALRMCIEALCDGGRMGVPSRLSRNAETKGKRTAILCEIAGLWKEVVGRGVTLWTALESTAKSGGDLSNIYKTLEALRSVNDKDVSGFLKIASENMRPWANREEFMEEINAWLEELRTHSQHVERGVRIMTLQSAKGLEAEVVFVIGLNEGIIPRYGLGEEELAESARLTYVSMTRAMTELHLFHARKRDASVTYLKGNIRV
jgi:DNA helicase-2/ATP-dependent DNA helicase PcrA